MSSRPGTRLLVCAYAGVLGVAALVLCGQMRARGGSSENPSRWGPGSGESGSGPSERCRASEVELVGGGWTKAVYKARVAGLTVAIKTVNWEGRDVQECRGAGGSPGECYGRAADKILAESALLSRLRHENVLEVLDSCIPDVMGPVAMVTELGDALDTIKLLQLPWEDRLRLALATARILHRLAHSPLGSLSMNDFRRQQFVLVGGTTLKLSDVDDVGLDEPPCASAPDCLRHLPPAMEPGAGPPCERGRCVGHNERLNVWHAGRHLAELFLALGAPPALEPSVRELLGGYRGALWTSEQILGATERLVASFASGDYRENGTTSLRGPAARQRALLGFEMYKDSDLPGKFDYRCRESLSTVGCIMSVLNEVEAAEMCSKDLNCKAVVLGVEHTWTVLGTLL